jgi:hypothetical protein
MSKIDLEELLIDAAADAHAIANANVQFGWGSANPNINRLKRFLENLDSDYCRKEMLNNLKELKVEEKQKLLVFAKVVSLYFENNPETLI